MERIGKVESKKPENVRELKRVSGNETILQGLARTGREKALHEVINAGNSLEDLKKMKLRNWSPYDFDLTLPSGDELRFDWARARDGNGPGRMYINGGHVLDDNLSKKLFARFAPVASFLHNERDQLGASNFTREAYKEIHQGWTHDSTEHKKLLKRFQEEEGIAEAYQKAKEILGMKE